MSILRDVRYGARTLRKSPALVVVATLALGIGIGLSATMWSIIYGALIKGLPYADGDRIVVVFRANPSRNANDRMGVSIHDYSDYAAQQKSFDAFGGDICGTVNVSGTEKAERYDGCFVTAGILAVTGVKPLLGRIIQPGEDRPGGDRVAVIGYSMWQTRYGGAGDIVGRTIRVNGLPHTVVGVMPEGFLFPNNSQIWVPFQGDPLATKRGEGQDLSVVARLRPGVTLDAATVELAGIAKRIEKEHKETNEGITALVQPFVSAYIGPEATRLLYTMLGAV